MSLTELNGSRKKNRVELSTIVYGKVPPQAKDIEEVILGALMLDINCVSIAMAKVFPEMFYIDAHSRIFSSIRNLYDKNIPIDIINVIEQLKKDENLEAVGGPYFITRLTNSVVSGANIESHILVLSEMFLKRQTILICGEGIQDAYEYETDAFDIISKVDDSIQKMQEKVLTGSQKDISYYGMKTLEQHAITKQTGVLGVPTGLIEIDKTICGLVAPDLIIIAARPGQGKTSLALSITYNASILNKVPCAWFSLEMDGVQLVRRLASIDTGISHEIIRTGKTSKDEDYLFGSSINKISNSKIFIEDKVNITVRDIRTRSAILKKKHKIEFIVVDYIQLMNGIDTKNKNREQIISDISRGLKTVSKELEMPVIALSQLSRAVEARTDKMPILSDLRECLPTSEYVYTPEGPVKIGTRPEKIITCNDRNVISSCEFIEKKYNTVYCVKTQFGQFRATANHLVLTGIGWKKVCDLIPGRDVIASPKYIPHANKGYLPHGRMLGLLIGNGSLSGTPGLIYRCELDAFVREAAAKFGVQVQYRKNQKSANVFDTYLSNGVESGCTINPLMKWLRELGLEGKTCHNKFIPESYLGSSDETHRDLLQGLWESDGTVTVGVAKYATVSEILARQVGWLLLTIGVRSTVNLYNDIWEVRCSKTDNENMRVVVDNNLRFGNLSIPSEDYIDPAPSIFIELANELISNTVVRLQKKTTGGFKSISKSRFKKLTENYPIPTIDQSPYMQLENIGWGRLQSVEKETGEVRVCDLHVPFTHNFITNGIVVHNSGAIEQDADEVIFLMRPEYYHMTDDVTIGGREYSVSGLTITSIAKNRHGATKNVALNFRGSTMHFTNNIQYDGFYQKPESGWKQVNEVI